MIGTQRIEVSRRALGLLFAATLGVGVVTPEAYGASGTWTGGAGDGLWASPGNWAPGVPGALIGTNSPDVATFTGAPTSTEVAVDAGRNISGITFDNTSTAMTVGSTAGPALTLSAGGTIRSTATVTIPNETPGGMLVAAPLVLTGSYSFVNDAPAGPTPQTEPATGPSLRVSGAITATGGSPVTLTLSGSNSAGRNADIYSQVSGALSDGAGAAKLGITKTGTGAWELNSTVQSTYSGPTVINQGTLRIATVAGLSPNTDVIVNAGGAWRSSLADVKARSFTMNLGAAFSVSTAGAHTIRLTAESGPAITMNYAGGAGGVQINSPWALDGTVPLEGGVKLVADSQTPAINIGATNSPFILGNVVRVFEVGKGSDANTNFDLRVRGPVSGGTSTGVVKTGPGWLRFDNASQNWGGTVEVREGRFSFSFNGAMTGSVAVAVTGGDMRIGSDSQQTFSSVSVTKGLISGANDAATIRSNGGFTFNVGAGDTATATAAMGDGASAASVVKNGAGTAVLGGNNTYTGGTTVNAGTLTLRGSAPRNHVLDGAGASVALGATLGFDYDGANGGGTVRGQIETLLEAGQPGNFATGPIRSASPAATKGFALVDDGNAVFVTSAYYGDLNLDGRVNGDDYARIDRGRAMGLSGWVNGDFNYDDVVDAADYLRMDMTFGTGGVPHAAFAALVAERRAEFGEEYVQSLVAAVPEPGSALAVAGGLLLVGRRRRAR